METIKMIESEHLDVRTITMGISLLDCIRGSAKETCELIRAKIARTAKDLVKTGEDLEKEFGIPIIHKRISVTPIALVAGSTDAKDAVMFAKALDQAAKDTGVYFIGGFSALVQKGCAKGDVLLMDSIP